MILTPLVGPGSKDMTEIFALYKMFMVPRRCKQKRAPAGLRAPSPPPSSAIPLALVYCASDDDMPPSNEGTFLRHVSNSEATAAVAAAATSESMAEYGASLSKVQLPWDHNYLSLTDLRLNQRPESSISSSSSIDTHDYSESGCGSGESNPHDIVSIDGHKSCSSSLSNHRQLVLRTTASKGTYEKGKVAVIPAVIQVEVSMLYPNTLRKKQEENTLEVKSLMVCDDDAKRRFCSLRADDDSVDTTLGTAYDSMSSFT